MYICKYKYTHTIYKWKNMAKYFCTKIKLPFIHFPQTFGSAFIDVGRYLSSYFINKQNLKSAEFQGSHKDW